MNHKLCLHTFLSSSRFNSASRRIDSCNKKMIQCPSDANKHFPYSHHFWPSIPAQLSRHQCSCLLLSYFAIDTLVLKENSTLAQSSEWIETGLLEHQGFRHHEKNIYKRRSNSADSRYQVNYFIKPCIYPTFPLCWPRECSFLVCLLTEFLFLSHMRICMHLVSAPRSSHSAMKRFLYIAAAFDVVGIANT